MKIIIEHFENKHNRNTNSHKSVLQCNGVKHEYKSEVFRKTLVFINMKRQFKN